MSNLVLDTLLRKREQLRKEQEVFLEKSSTEIRELDDAIAKLNGGVYVYGNGVDSLYDDEHPDYIKQSEEEI